MMETSHNETLAALKVAAAPSPVRIHVSNRSSSSSFVNDKKEDDAKVMKTMEKVEEQLSVLCYYECQNENHGSCTINRPKTYPCDAAPHNSLPLEPSKWPQKPIMLCPTPAGGTVVRGVRFANSNDYQDFQRFCRGCILPINNGTESRGDSLVVDFESELFVGTLLLRMRDAPPNDFIKPSNLKQKASEHNDYFEGKKRRFQFVVKGKFKEELKISECVTGQVFDRPAGKLPAKWIISSFVKFVSVLSPHLEVNLSGEKPRFLAPLAATAMTIIEKQTRKREGEESDVNNNMRRGSQDMEDSVEEPFATDSASLMQQAKEHHGISVSAKKRSTILWRQQARKKTFNSIYAQRAAKPMFQLDKEYTFEFYQHLLLFDDTLAIDMGRVVGKVPLGPALNGQPIKLNAAHKEAGGKLSFLWNFDLWHEDLYELAEKAASDVPNDL